METSICLIEINIPIGTGFFVKLNIPSKEKPMYGLMTNNHVLDSESIKPGKSFFINFNNKFKKKINIKNDFIFTSEFIDVTFIQLNNEIINDIKSFNPSLQFFEPNINECTKKEDIYQGKKNLYFSISKL